MSEFLRMNGMYWGVACMDLMGRLEVRVEKFVQFYSLKTGYEKG